MAISGGDGSIILSTKVDTSGTRRGFLEILSSAKKYGEQSKDSFQPLLQIIESQKNQLNSLNKEYAELIITNKKNTKEAENLRKKIDSLSDEMKENEKVANSLGITSQKSFSKMGNILSSVASKIALMFSVTTLINFGKEAINLASDLQEVQNVVDTAFGSMSYKIEEFSKTAIENFGISRLTAKRTASTYMAMAKGMGIAEDEASDMAITMTGLTADIASFYNMSQERADVVLKSVYTGETESLKQLGIVMTEVNLEQFAMSKGITKNIRNMTQQEKTMLRYQFVLEQTKLAQGDFAKTQDSWANQTRILSERWKEMQATFGEAFMAIGTLFLPIINKIVSGLTQIAQMAVTASKAVYKLFTGKELQTSQNQQASSIQQSVENQDALTESVKETAKEQQKLIAGFDEITKLSETEKESTAGVVADQFGTQTTGTPLTVDSTQVQQATSEISSTLATIMGIAGVALIALGLLLIVTGHIAWGIGFIIAGAGALAITMATLKSTEIGQDVKDKITAGLVIAGLVAVVIGILLCFAQHWGLGIGLIALGATTIVGSVALNWNGVKQKLQGPLGAALAVVGVVAIVIGILLCFAQMWALGIGLIAVGATTVGTTVALNFNSITNALANFFRNNTGLIVGVSSALLVLGIILCATGVMLPLGVSLIAAGAGSLVSQVAINWQTIKTKTSEVFNGLLTWLKTWGLLVLGVILVASGVGLPLGIALIKKAGYNLTQAQNPMWNIIVSKVQEVWERIKNFWNTHIAKYFTAQWWTDLAKKVGNGLINGFESAVNGIITLFENMINWVVSGLNKISVQIPDWVPTYGGNRFGVNLPYVNLGRVSIPRLATGAVIPPNREFLAVLGDQKHGTNIETPLQTMIDAFNIALNQRGGENQTIVLTLDGDVLFRTVVNKNRDYVNAMGVNPLGV